MDLCLPLCRIVLAFILVIGGREVYGLPFPSAPDEYPSSWRLHEPQTDFLTAMQVRECLNREDGIHPDSTNPCRHYVVCRNQRVILSGKCPPERVFDPSTRVCTSIWNAENTDYNCKTQIKHEILSGDAYIADGKKGLNLIQAPGFLKFFEKKPHLQFIPAMHKIFTPEEAIARIDSLYNEENPSEFVRDVRQIKFGSFRPDYEYGSEFSGSVSKKKEARQIKFDPLLTQESRQAYQLPPDFYWRRDF